MMNLGTVVGYVYDQPGRKYKYKYYFEGTGDKIARFLQQNEKYECVITTIADEFIVNSNVGLLDSVCDNNTRSEILHTLIKYQYGMQFNPLRFKEDDMSMIEI